MIMLRFSMRRSGKVRRMRNKGKYNAQKVLIGNILFDSRAEGRRYTELLMLQSAGVISELETHPTYVLQSAYRNEEGKKIQAITYTADFSYMENGSLVVEDVKGFRTAVFNLKARMFGYRYPKIKFRIVNA